MYCTVYAIRCTLCVTWRVWDDMGLKKTRELVQNDVEIALHHIITSARMVTPCDTITNVSIGFSSLLNSNKIRENSPCTRMHTSKKDSPCGLGAQHTGVGTNKHRCTYTLGR